MDEKKGCLYRLFRMVYRIFKGVLLLALLLFCLFCGAFAPHLYNRFSLYPRQAAAWRELALRRQPVQLKMDWTEFRGVVHSHSELSHDSLVTFPEIVEAMHKAKCQFILMSDHVVDGKADYSLGWKGVHDGVLFVRGYEMQEGFFPWGIPDGTVFSREDDPAALAKRIREMGGVLGLGHNEAMRPWEIPEIDAMEIYNIHTDLLDEMIDKNNRIETIKDFLINLRVHGDQTFRGIFDPWVLGMVAQKWDEQLKYRKITAVAANDCHQNVGLRGIYTGNDSLILMDTGHNEPEKKIAEFRLNTLTRPLLRWCFGELTPERQLFRVDLDPYERSSRFVNTHLLASELTEPALMDALRAGRAFVAFNLIGDAEGFAFVAEGGAKQVTMGESIILSPGLKLRAESPLPCHFTLIRRGKAVTSQEGTAFEFAVSEPGKYRIEAALPIPGELTIAGEEVLQNMAPWVITNPIEVLEQKTPASSPEASLNPEMVPSLEAVPAPESPMP